MGMPARGTQAYDDLVEETGGGSLLPGFDYDAHIASLTTQPVAPDAPRPDESTDAGQQQSSPPTIYLINPPKEMPEPGTKEYELLVLEIGHIPTSAFNYEAHIEATRGSSIEDINNDLPKDLAGNPIYLLNPPKEMPTPGSKEFELLVLEIGFIPTKDFNYAAHIEATRGQSIGSFEDYIDPFEMVIQRLYTAAFKRAPDKNGLNFWTEVANDPLTNFKDISSEFINSVEFSEIAPPDSTNEFFTSALYNNILGRDPDASGLEYWTSQLDSELQDRSDVLMAFANSPENIALNELLI